MHAERLGLAAAGRQRLSVRNVCGSNLSHSATWKSGCSELNPAFKWFLNVWIDLSAKLELWLCGSISWNYTLCFNMVNWRSPEVSLSRIQVLGVLVDSANWLWRCNHAFSKVLACLFFTGVPIIAFESTL